MATDARTTEVPRITAGELRRRIVGGDKVTVVDVRAPEAYQERHVPGAISLPKAEAEAHLAELPRDGQIVFYCT